MSWATAPRAPGSSTASPRPLSSSRCVSWGPTIAARAPRSRPASSGPSTRARAWSTSACRRRATRCSRSSTSWPDAAYFANVLLVSAANNTPGASYPSLFAAVVSVAAHDLDDPWTFFYNPSPPVEFGARGVDVDVAWRGWQPHRRHGQQLCRAAHGRDRDAHPRQAPRASPFRDQGHPCGHVEWGDARGPRSQPRRLRRRRPRPRCVPG